MQVDLTERSISEQIKVIANIRNCSVKTLGEKFNQHYNTNYSQQSFSRKLSKGNFNFDELKTAGDILGFKVKLELIDKGSD